MTSNITVVGNRFGGFATSPGVETVDSFTSLLGAQSAFSAPVLVRAGQGITETDWDQLIGRAYRAGYGNVLTFEQRDSALVGTHEAHKRCEQNTLLADLDQRDGASFAAALRLHNDNELLLDHQTGRHVQGMVCIEASRQMFLAVTERYIAAAYPDIDYYYVIDTMNTTFENFLFPTSADVRMEVLTADRSDPERLTCEADIIIDQAGRCCSRTYVRYTAFRIEVLAPIEARRAERAVTFAAIEPEVAA